MFALAAILAATALGAGSSAADTFFVDMSHPTPTFKPMDGEPMKPDTGQPWLDSKPIPSFGQQSVLSFGEFPTNQGKFHLGLLISAEHHGTHMDSPAHYANNAETMEPGGTPPEKRKLNHQMGPGDLTGRVVLIDISARVQAELDKNGGRPSPDTSVTDFSDDSGNVVTADDIAAVADKLDNGVWVVLHQGWSRFYFQGADFAKDPYINGWNFPGLNPAAVDKLIEIEDAKGIRINGVVSDVLGVETGQNSRGADEAWTDSWRAHVRGFQRGWKFVENGTNAGQLAMAKADGCTLIVGAQKHVHGMGGPARVFAMCER
jgi:kynurenine formamidase